MQDIVNNTYMPKEFTWGPAEGQEHHTLYGTLASGTPQEVYLAYIAVIKVL
jgi:hypothetical protein